MAEGTEWSKRRFLISKFIQWRRRSQAEKAEDAERQSGEEGSERIIEIDDSGVVEEQSRKSSAEGELHLAGSDPAANTAEEGRDAEIIAS